MFWNALRRIHRSGRLDVASIEEILSVNFRTAWIHREEDDRLPQSYRGVSLLDAYSQYKSAGIRLLKGPDSPFEYHALTGVDSRIPDSSEVRDAVVSLDESFSEFMASPIEGAVRVIQAGGIEDSERLKRHRESKTTAFFPENWRGIARCESSFRKGGHWSTGLPIVFWFEKGKGDGDLHLRAEIGPWHDVDQRSRLVERLRDCDWSSTRGGGGATYCRFWWRRVAPSVPDLEGMRDAWAELSEFLPDIDAALQDFGFIA
ncbi:MAG: hypothetical protein IV100_34465 [Myxococcales bacterium]|nr:hypothetical protein [Myxococcales bacterium]